MIDEVKSEASAGMDKSIEALKRDLGKVRTGRASLSLLDDVRVDYYGTPTPLNQVGSLAVPEPRMITIQPWEKNLIPEIEKAILKADLGLNPSSDGQLIRLAFPPLTEERRKDMIRIVRHEAEGGRVAIRNIRRDAMHDLKELLKEKEISEDDERRGEEAIQQLTNKYVAEVDQELAEKEKELLEF